MKPSNSNIMGCILFMTVLAVMESAAARELFPAPMASQDAATTVKSQSDVILEWLKVTAVPLGVFLVGACTWGCIKNSAAWRRFTERRGSPSDTSGGDEVRPERLSYSSGADGSDHSEEEEALPNHRRDIADMAAIFKSAGTVKLMQQAALQSPNGEGNDCPSTDVAPDQL